MFLHIVIPGQEPAKAQDLPPDFVFPTMQVRKTPCTCSEEVDYPGPVYLVPLCVCVCGGGGGFRFATLLFWSSAHLIILIQKNSCLPEQLLFFALIEGYISTCNWIINEWGNFCSDP